MLYSPNVDGGRIRKEKVAESKIPGYVWTDQGRISNSKLMGTALPDCHKKNYDNK